MGAVKQAMLEAAERECVDCASTSETKSVSCQFCGDRYATCEDCGRKTCPACEHTLSK